MKRFLTGCLIGFVVATGTSVVAQNAPRAVTGWFSGANLMQRSHDARTGYAAGVHDSIELLQFLSSESPDDSTLMKGALERTSHCFNRRSAGNLEQFTSFAEERWLGSSNQAAAILITDACN
jgi:hypothetical protein